MSGRKDTKENKYKIIRNKNQIKILKSCGGNQKGLHISHFSTKVSSHRVVIASEI